MELVRGWPQVAALIAYTLRQDEDAPDYGLITPAANATTSWTTYGQAVAVPNSTTSYPSGAVDAPAEGGAVVGSATVSGWALDEGAATGTGVDRVQVYLDGVYRGDAEYGLTRPDIGAAYGARFAPSGYRYVLDMTGAAPGSHTIEVRARSMVTAADTASVRAIRTVQRAAGAIGSRRKLGQRDRWASPAAPTAVWFRRQLCLSRQPQHSRKSSGSYGYRRRDRGADPSGHCRCGLSVWMDGPASPRFDCDR